MAKPTVAQAAKTIRKALDGAHPTAGSKTAKPSAIQNGKMGMGGAKKC